MIGVGGVGSGMFFLLNGNHTLGREESRSGHFLEKNDYCKLHIIAHYVKALLGPDFTVVPIARIGNDDIGRRLTTEMDEVGMALDHLTIDHDRHTLFSFCFLYPDRSGGNMTTDDSACSAVNAATVLAAGPEFQRYAGRGVALAAPEVPLDARAALLDLATRHNFFRVASFTSEELGDARSRTMIRTIDLLCINLDEAASALGREVKTGSAESVANAAIRVFTEINPTIQVSITHGKEGSYVWDGSSLTYAPALTVEAVSTAGAGDAFTAGLIVGKVAGLSLKASQELATLVGACSVTSPHTIHKDLDRIALRALIRGRESSFSPNVVALLQEK
jgi:sugar/nucleoside kinase (ribokinase family)